MFAFIFVFYTLYNWISYLNKNGNTLILAYMLEKSIKNLVRIEYIWLH
jgi:hypothetical protein